jgi:hypothetical protein
MVSVSGIVVGCTCFLQVRCALAFSAGGTQAQPPP